MFLKAIKYGLLLVLGLSLIKYLEYRFLYQFHQTSMFVGLIAIIFIALGIYVGKIWRSNTVSEKVESQVDEQTIHNLGLSQREVEVLNGINSGWSNKEIGEHLFLSENTIKTHVAKLYEKLDVNKRTQAIAKARRLKIIA